MKERKKQNFWIRLKTDIGKNWILYAMVLPVILYYVIFAYVPMYGVTLAFKDYKIKLGILGSPWVGLEHFKRFFSIYNVGNIIKNTLEISIYGFLVGFPLAIIFALMLNYLQNKYLKKVVQMASYAPYFISTVVICGMISMFTNLDTGIFNTFRNVLGLESVDFMGVSEWFKDIYVWSGVWQGMGWSAIIYMSALAGVDQQLHESAIIDGATKMQRIWHIDLPSIKPTIVMLLILNLGGIMGVGFEKVYLLQNAMNLSESEIISTYIYKEGLINNDFAYSTAVGLFNSVINLMLLVTFNKLSKLTLKESLF